MTHLQAVLDQLEAERFVGRHDELAMFRRLLDLGRPALLNVHGIAGIGKTTLLRAFARAAAAAGRTHILLDGAGMQPTPREFCRLLQAALTAAAPAAAPAEPAAATLANCHAALTRLAGAGPLVLALDGYEDMQPLDRWLRQTFLPGIPTNTLLIIAGRHRLGGEWLHSPAWRELVRPLPLYELTLPQTRELLGHYDITEERTVHGLWLGTMGHPLALSLAAPLASSGIPLLETSPETDEVFHGLCERWLRHAASGPLRPLVEAAATLPEWDQDVLSHLHGAPVPMTRFEELIRLSFVRRTLNGWALHALVRGGVAATVEAASPSRQRQFRQRALQYVHGALLAAPAGDIARRARLVSQALYLIGGPLIRLVFAHDPAESGYSVSPVTPSELTEWSAAPAWRSTTYLARLLQPLASADQAVGPPPPHERGRDPRQCSPNALQELLTLDPECILVLRNAVGAASGIAVAIPISEATLPFLLSQPVTAPYFDTLSPDELKAYARPPDQPAGCFIRAIGLANPEDSTALAAMLYHLIPLLFAYERVLASTPLPFYRRILHGLGFEEVPGASHYNFGPDVAAPTFLLDLRGLHLPAHLERLAAQVGFDSLSGPGPLAELGLTARESQVAARVAEGKSNREVAAELHLSEITVKKHLSRVLAKAGLKTRGQLIRLVHEAAPLEGG